MCEFGGKASLPLNYLTTKDSEMEDGKITLIRSDIDQLPSGTKTLTFSGYCRGVWPQDAEGCLSQF